MNDKNNKPSIESLLVEYQAAQDSAHHHDNQIWNTTGIIWGASLILIGFVVQAIGDPSIRLIIIAVSALSILMLVYLWVMALRLNSLKNQKYSRCKEIESILHLEQHSRITHARISGKVFFGLVMTVFIAVWSFILLTTLFA